MKRLFTLSLFVFSFNLLFAVSPADEVSNLGRTLAKEKKTFRERSVALKALLAEPRVATNRLASYRAYHALAQCCLLRSWPDNKYYDYDLIGEVYPEIMPKVLAGPYSDEEKVGFVEMYVHYFACAEKYDEGVRMVKDQIAKLQKLSEKSRARLKIALAEMYRYADRCDDALAAARAAMADDLDKGAAEGARIASAWQREDVRREFILKMTPPAAAEFVCPIENNFWQRDVPDWIRPHLEAFVMDASKPPRERIAVFTTAFYRDLTPAGEKMLAAMLALPEADVAGYSYRTDFTVGMTYACGSWARAAKLYELGLRCKSRKAELQRPNWRRVYLGALDAGGRKDEAIRLAGEFAADAKLSPVDKATYEGLRALFSDQEGGATSVSAALPASLTPKEKSEVIQTVGRYAMTVAKTEAAERLAKAYEGCFKPRETRRMKVTYSAEPIRSISDWRKIHAKLPKGLCDIPFGEDIQDLVNLLVTDVTTQRNVKEKGKGDTLDNRLEFTCVADRYALHLFLRTPDPQARDVEHGFVNGISTEMYFAPGLAEPYICFGADPLKGVEFLMNTQYESEFCQRIDPDWRGGRMKSEVSFSDTDYVVHVTMPWRDFYRKLPKPGAEWKFDCIAWAPSGPKTWGGSRGIHHSSDWGRLVFDLKPAELTEIRRELILANYKSWSTPKPAGHYRTLDRFEKWRLERTGDRAFYDACLKDREAELKALQAKVSPKMDDATVNEVYEKGLVPWLGIAQELDERRRQYLANKFLTAE